MSALRAAREVSGETGKQRLLGTEGLIFPGVTPSLAGWPVASSVPGMEQSLAHGGGQAGSMCVKVAVCTVPSCRAGV